MKLRQAAIPDILVIEPTVFADERGWFMESFNEKHFHDALNGLGLAIPPGFVQDNHSYSHKGVLRGLHYQMPPYEQGKLVRVSQGSVYDVAVDIRASSSSFGKWVAYELSAENNRMVWIPPGFAHGFLTLENQTHFHYKTTDFYHKEAEAAIRWNDPELAIAWPLEVEPLLNEKDSLAPFWAELTPIGSNSKKAELIDLEVIGDSRGSLIVLEKASNLPFDLKRVYYIFDTKKEISRGFHAHRNLQQLAVCVSGKCRIVVDNGKTRQDFWLDSPTKGLLIDHLVWREMHDFSEDCVLAVFASAYYNEADYIRDYQEFIREINRG